MTALSEIIEKANVEEGWKKDARNELFQHSVRVNELEVELRRHAFHNHAHMIVEGDTLGHRGSFDYCPQKLCVDARDVLAGRAKKQVSFS
jgi:hypothetical protein